MQMALVSECVFPLENMTTDCYSYKIIVIISEGFELVNIRALSETGPWHCKVSFNFRMHRIIPECAMPIIYFAKTCKAAARYSCVNKCKCVDR